MDETKRFILTQIKNLNVYKRGGERAPHKPLLMLLALARVTQRRERLALFSEIEEPLSWLLKDYGPPRKSVHPEYPFWWLQSDKLWEVSNGDSLLRRAGSTSPLKSEFIKKKVCGGLPEYIYEVFTRDSKFLESAVSILLEGNFPESLHQDILNEVGLSVSTHHRRRSPQFRSDVIRAYEHRCAICGFDLKLGPSDLALEAAHIKWHQSGGPDCVQNGLALCAIHHKSLDRGAIGISRQLTEGGA
ncbi:MAG: phosphorothioated DNA-binding restriction endonuclease [Pyrinomonadaceae bacterium]